MKFNIVTGLRRSGTSLMMLCLRQSGVPIIGSKYMIYALNENGDTTLKTTPSQKERRGNPNGYWELGSITTKTGVKQEHMDLGMDGDVIKVTSDAFYFSDPKMVDKTIVMVREPRKVLFSMIRGEICREEDAEKVVEKNIRDMRRTKEFLRSKKKLIINYDELVSHPLKILQEVNHFIGKLNIVRGAKVIDQTLNRSDLYSGEVKGIEKWEKLYKTIIGTK